MSSARRTARPGRRRCRGGVPGRGPCRPGRCRRSSPRRAERLLQQLRGTRVGQEPVLGERHLLDGDPAVEPLDSGADGLDAAQPDLGIDVGVGAHVRGARGHHPLQQRTMRSTIGMPSSRRRRRSFAIRSASASPAECGTHGPPYSVLSRWQWASTSPGRTSRPATSSTLGVAESMSGSIRSITVAHQDVRRARRGPRAGHRAAADRTSITPHALGCSSPRPKPAPRPWGFPSRRADSNR